MRWSWKFAFVVLDTFFDVVFSVAQHSVNQARQVVSHRYDCFWSAKSGSQAAVLGSQRALAVSQALGAEAQGVGSTVVNLTGDSA